MANVVFLWHMHQPYYVNPVTRTAMMPWVRLHSVKGYLDMISVIEEFPGVRVNFNLTPVLLMQIKELIEGEVRDLWLEWARKPAADLSEEEKFAILENFSSSLKSAAGLRAHSSQRSRTSPSMSSLICMSSTGVRLKFTRTPGNSSITEIISR